MKKIIVSVIFLVFVPGFIFGQLTIPTRYSVSTPGTGNSCFDRAVTLSNGKVVTIGFFQGSSGETPTVMMFNPSMQGLIEWALQFSFSFMTDVVFPDNTGSGVWLGSVYNGRLLHLDGQGNVTNAISLFTNQSGYNTTIDVGVQLPNGYVMVAGRVIDINNNQTRLYIATIDPATKQIVASQVFTLNGNTGFYDFIDMVFIGNYVMAALYDGNINNRTFLITSFMLTSVTAYTSPFGYVDPRYFLPGSGSNLWMVGSGISGNCTGSECAMIALLDLANPVKLTAYFLSWQVNYMKTLYAAGKFSSGNFLPGTDIISAWGGQYDWSNGLDKSPFNIEFNTATQTAIRNEWANEAGNWYGVGDDLLAFGCFNNPSGNSVAVVEKLPAYNTTDDCMTQSQVSVTSSTINMNTSSVNPVTSITLNTGTFTVTPTTVTPTLAQQCGHSCDLVAFYFNPDTVCTGSPVQFTDSSFGNPGPATWFWTFGDGGTSTQRNPTHTYTSPGTYSVKLVVYDDWLCKDSFITDIVVCNGPTAGAFMPDPVCMGSNPVTFTMQDASTPGSCNLPIVSSVWYLSGDSMTFLGQTHDYTFTTTGTWTVTHTVIDAAGCVDSIHIPIVIHGGPKALFRWNPAGDTICEYDTVYFADSSLPGDAPIVSWHWDFDDGTFSTQKNPIHAFSTIGNIQDFMVKLVVTDSNGCSDSVTHIFHVNKVPVIQVNAPNDTCFDWINGNTINFSYNVLVPGDNPIMGNIWDFDDGNFSNQANPSHKFNAPGTYAVSLCVFDSYLCEACDTFYLTLFDGPEANFDATTPVCAGAGVHFTDKSKKGDAPIVSWFWNFGDGNTANIKNPTHAYGLGGVYWVTLIVTDANGCTDEITDSVFIYEIAPSVSASNTAPCPNEDITFTDNSQPSQLIGNVDWSFGDGYTASGHAVTHGYSASGVYQVMAIVTDTLNSCQDTVYLQITVQNGPDARFVYDTICIGDTMHFADTSLGNVVTWYWEFGDGDTSWLQNPVHYYAPSDTYKVFHKVWDGQGCWDTVTHFIFVDSLLPVAGFTANATGNSVQFQNTSQYAHAWLWEFGDGDTSTQENPLHNYTSTGSYQVTLTVWNGCGADTTTSTLVLTGLPQAAIPMVNIYPVPATSRLVIEWQNLDCTPCMIRITDASGRVVETLPAVNVSGPYTRTVDLSGYARGLYIIRVENDQITFRQKFIVQ